MKKIYLILGVIFALMCCLAACTPSSEELQKMYEENDFEISDVTVDEYGYDSDAVTYAFKAVRSDDDNVNVVVISFTNSQDATDFYDTQNKLKDDESSLVKIRNTVVLGTKEAVELAKNK